MDVLIQAVTLAFSPQILGIMLLAAVFGLFVGAAPGLTATMATALLVPITFFMPPLAAIAAIISCSAMAIFAGDIPAALIRIPGTPASAAYVDDAYILCRQGRLDLALGTNVTASAIGGIFGTIVLVVAAPQLADWALNFSSYEYFWLALVGLSCATLVSTGSPLKGLVSLCLGLAFAIVGLDVVTGQPRFTFGSMELMGGLSLVSTLIGAFAVSELLRKATTFDERLPKPPADRQRTAARPSPAALEISRRRSARQQHRHSDRCAARRRRRHRRLDILRRQQEVFEDARVVRSWQRRGYH